MSTTPSERKALLFLAALLSLGAVARFVSALRHEQLAAAPLSDTALTAQIAAVDSARVRARASRQRSVPRAPPRARSARKAKSAVSPSTAPAGIIDVDRASAAELDQLPRIGPALAQRIVRDREEHGPFGSLTTLTRVKGIGPKVAARLAEYVTFSGSARPPTALSVSPGSAPQAGRPPPPG